MGDLIMVDEDSVESVRSKVEGNPPPRSTMRVVGMEEFEDLQRMLSVAKKRVRVYSRQGFVPGSYKWPCRIQYIEANRVEDGLWQMRVGVCGAQRSHGRGSLIVVDGRGV